MLRRCDLDEQVSATARHGREVRPDVVVRLPGGKVLVIDAEGPDDRFRRSGRRGRRGGAAYLVAGTREGAARARRRARRQGLLERVRDDPGDGVVLRARRCRAGRGVGGRPRALRVRPALPGRPSSPATLLAVLRAVAFTWQQDALASNARELLSLGADLYERLGTLAGRTPTAWAGR